MKLRRYVIVFILLFFSGTNFLFSQTQTTINDVDSNIYKIVKIGTQLWFAENLKTTKYNDGTEIPVANEANSSDYHHYWALGYCWYNNDMAKFKPSAGALYSWDVIRTNKLCPAGWHVPTTEEWSTLLTFLGNRETNEKLMENGNDHWVCQNNISNNETGFTAIPSGYRSENRFFGFGKLALFWSSSYYKSGAGEGNETVIYYYINCELNNVLKSSNPDYHEGPMYSVRCIKDGN